MISKVYRPCIVLLLAFCGVKAVSQQNKIVGKVIDEKGKPVRQATASLLRSTDSSLVKAALSDENGEFELPALTTGPFLLSISFIGYETYYVSVIPTDTSQVISTQPISLARATKQLQGITITSKRPLIAIKADRTVLNVQQSINASGSNALELLQKSPGVSVDNNDNISMKGKAGVRIYIDEKVVPLNAEDLAAYLKSITSNDIETIEFISSPGARYDASGNAGIINIRLRKNSNLGTNGSFTAGLVQGITPKGNGSLNVNFRDKKMNIFSNVSTGIGLNETNIIAPRIQKDTLYDQQLQQMSDGRSFNIKSGVDFYIDKNQTIGIMNTSGFANEDWASHSTTPIVYTPTGTYIKQLVATNDIDKSRASINTNFNYRYTDSTGKEINVDADYGLYRGRSKSYQPNFYRDKNDELMAAVITHNNTPTDIDIYTAKIDMTSSKWKGKLEYGAKFSLVKTSNLLDFFNEENGSIRKAGDRSYHFVYRENVNAAYMTYQRRFTAKWNLQAGMRMEQTNSEGELTRGDGVIQQDHNIRRSYLDVFPNATITYSPNQLNNISLGYGRRIDRPNYQNLNPFELKLDELSYVKGNAFLRPQYTDNIELAWSWRNKLTITAGYSRINDLVTQTVDTLNNYTYAYSRNIATQQISSLSVNYIFSIVPWWNGFMNVWGNYQVFRGRANESEIDIELAAYGAFMQQGLSFGKNYSAEITGWFNGPSALTATLKAKSLGALDIGFQKLLWNKRATIKVVATDIFKTSIPFRAKTDFGGVFLQFWVKRESQTIRLSFAYRFGSNKIKTARQRQPGLENETKRISNG